MKYFNKRIILTLTAFVLSLSALVSGLTVRAASNDIVPSQSYTYWESGTKKTLVNTKAMYEVEETFTAESLGINSFSQIADMCLGPDGSIYITDSDEKSLTVIDSTRTSVKKLKEFTFEGNIITLNKPTGIFVSAKNEIYLCDSGAGTIIVSDINGSVNKVINAPKTDILPEEFNYQPIKIAVDPQGYTYVLSDGSYYGALCFAPEGNFVGFYGANSVKAGVVEALKNLWDKLTMTDEKRASSVKSLPYVFTDLCIDNGGFVYTATGTTDSQLPEGSIRRLSPGGVNILKSDEVVFGENEVTVYSTGTIKKQDLSGLTVDDQGFIFAYDRALGNIYMYDVECNLITAFGGGMGEGTQDGTFQLPCAIEVYGDRLYICDSNTAKITVFKPTDYGMLIRDLQKKTLDGDYENTTEGWKYAISQDKNCQLAYIGLAKASLIAKDYETALKYSKLGDDRETYAQAYEYLRGVWLNKNFAFIFCGAILILALVIALLVIKKKKGIVLIKNHEVKLALNASIHPAAVFREIQEKNRGSMLIGIILIIIYYITEILKNDLSGFMFSTGDKTAFNSLIVLGRSAGAVIIWTISNWMVSTLFIGRGKMKQIFIITSYSIMPLIVTNVAYTVLSNLLVPSEAAFMSLLMTLAMIYMFVILAIGTIIIHDFSFGKFVGTALLSVLGLLIIIFMIAATIILVQQIGAFFVTLFFEIVYR